MFGLALMFNDKDHVFSVRMIYHECKRSKLYFKM